MIPQMLTRTARFTRPTGSRSARRIASLTRAEALLLRRNPIALLTAAAMPVAMVLFVSSSMPNGAGGGGVGDQVVATLTAFTLVFVIYYNLVRRPVTPRSSPGRRCLPWRSRGARS